MAGNLLLERQGGVFIVTINRPARRNAIDHATAHELEAAWDRLDNDSDLRAAVLTGAEGFFCAGADLKAAAAGEPPAKTERRGHFGTVRAPPQKPVLAAVEGDAFGGGFELALACDLILAARTSRFALPECRRGVLAAGGGVIRLPRRIPVNIAKEMALTGAPVAAERLFALGLLNRLTETGGAREAAIELATAIAANAPLAVAAAKRVMDGAQTGAETDDWARQQPELARLRLSADYREGIAAFAEKRPPLWQGK